MKYYLKNLLQSLKKNPTQPIVIMLIVIFTSSIFCIAMVFKDVFYEHNLYLAKQSVGEADLILSVNADSGTMFAYKDDVEAVLGEDGKAYGYFSMFCDYDGDIYSCMATDVLTVSEINPVILQKKGRISLYNINELVVVSSKFASEHDLGIGDEITLTILGNPLTFSIEGIAKDEGFFASTDMLVNMKGIVRYFLYELKLFAMPDTVELCTTVLVKASEGVDIDALRDRLATAPSLSALNVERAINGERIQNVSRLESMITFITALLLMLVGIALIFTAFSIYVSKRLHNIALFKSIGANSATLVGSLLLEGILYALIGSTFGILLAKLLVKRICVVLELGYIATMTPSMWLPSIAMSVVCIALAIVVPSLRLARESVDSLLRGQISQKKHDALPIIFISLAGAIATSLCFAFLPKTDYMALTIADMLFILTLIFFATPYFCNLFSFTSSKILDKLPRQNFSSVALRTIRRNDGFKNMTRIVTVGALILTCIGTMLDALNVQVKYVSNVLDFDFAVIAPSNARIEDDLQSIDGVKKTSRCYFKFSSSAGYVGNNVLAFEDDPGKYLHLEGKGYVPRGKLEGNQLIITEGIARAYDLKEGDLTSFVVNHKEREFQIAQIIDFPLPFLIVDAKYCELDCYLIVVDTEDEAKEAAYKQIQTTYSQKFYPVVTTRYFLSKGVETKFIELGFSFVYIISAFVAFGIFNSVIDNVRKRRKEYEILASLGATKGKIAGLIAAELAASVFISAIIVTAAYFLITQLIYAASLTYCVGLKVI